MTTEFVIATRLGEPIEYLKATDRKWATYLDPLADTASCTLSMDLANPLYVAPGQAELQVWRGGSLVWTGPLWKAQPDYSTGKLAVVAGGLATYFSDRALLDHLEYVRIDQETIFADLVNNRGAEVGITCPSPPLTGVFRDREWNDPAQAPEYPYLGALISQLAGVNDGFDWSIGPDRVARMWYPKRGQSLNLPLEHGANCLVESYDVDASPGILATRAFGFGKGDGKTMLRSRVVASDQTPAYGTRDAKFAFKTTDVLTALTEQTSAALARKASVRAVPSVVLMPDREPGLGDLELGDAVPVRAYRGRWSLESELRIVGIEVDDDQGGTETARLLMAEPNAPRTEEETA